MFNFLSDTSDGTSMVHLGGSQMAAKKIPKEEIDRVKFMENIRNQINLMSKATQDLEKQIRTFQDLYLRVINEEIDYNLKFYIVGDGLQYERIGRKKIGF